ncbi:MAG: hypothetical protein R3B09_23190 [Nannocystaceae bacterium]
MFATTQIRARRPLAAAVLALSLAGCLGPRGGAPTGDGEAAPGPAAGAPTAGEATVSDDVPLPLRRFLGQPPADVEALLGEPVSKGMVRGSCVRFVPKRVFFDCKHVEQTYADKTGTFREVRVEFDDGLASRVSFDGLTGDGPFSPEEGLKAVGLTLPGPGDLSSPAEGVQLWTWFNDKARLLLHGKEHRVEISIVQGDRARSRIDVIENHALTDDQKARIVETKPKNPVPAPTPSGPRTPVANVPLAPE